jgi:uncharacterized protein (DUF608 family)
MAKVRQSRRLFQAHALRSRLQRFACLGYEQPVLGTIYPRASLRWHGVPLGGLGTGYVCWDSDGRFSQCTLYNQVPNSSPVPVLNTIPFEVSANGRSWALAMKGEDGRGDLLDLRYFGHFPVADLQFDVDGPLALEVRAFAPFLPGDALTSNTPAIVLEAWLTNTSDEPVQAALRFAPPPPPRPLGTSSLFSVGSWQGVAASHPWDKASPKLGNRPIEHEVAIAVEGGEATVADGALTAVFRAELAPGAFAHTVFVLAWYQPYLRDSWNRAERLVYAQRFPGALAVAEQAIAGHRDWLRRIIAWQSAIYAHEELPAPLREALLNSFYATCKNSHWIAPWRPDDWFPAEGLFLLNESYTTCPLSETLPCHYLGSFPVLFFFPELERTTLEAYRHYQLASGEVPFSLDRGFGARAPNYQTQHNNGIGEYIEVLYRYWLRTGDEAFLRDFYPSAAAALRYLEFLDSDADGLPNEHPHALPGEFWPANVPWDNWPQWGTSSYTGLKSLTTCLALADMAAHCGDDGTVARCRDRLSRGRQRLERDFWNGAYYRLQVDPRSGAADETCLLALGTGAWSAALLGLEDPVPAERLRATLHAILERTGGLSAYGLVLAASPEGAPVYSNQRLECDFPRDVWPSFNFIAAAACQYYRSDQEAGLSAALQVLETLFRAANAMPWGWPCNLNGLDGWIGHGHDYQDPQTIWTLPMALAGQNLRQAAGPGSLVYDILTAAR